MNAQKKQKMLVVSAMTARARFGEILRRTSTQQERFIVNHRGAPQAIILSIEDFLANVVPENNLIKSIRTEAKRVGADKLTMQDINAEIAAHRREKRRKRAAA